MFAEDCRDVLGRSFMLNSLEVIGLNDIQGVFCISKANSIVTCVEV